MPDYALIYWADEGSMSAVKATCVPAVVALKLAMTV